MSDVSREQLQELEERLGKLEVTADPGAMRATAIKMAMIVWISLFGIVVATTIVVAYLVPAVSR